MERYLSPIKKKPINFPLQPQITYKTFTKPFRKLTLELEDDFYSNLIDWYNNYIIYLINNCVFLFDFHTSRNNILYTFDKQTCSSIKFCNENKIAIGCSKGELYYIDINDMSVDVYDQHEARIGVMDYDNSILFTGGRDGAVRNLDLRCNVSNLFGHHQMEVCGLKVSHNKNLLASGGNDNKIQIFDRRNLKNLAKIDGHQAAVKVISWSPINNNLLCSGGGTADKKLKIWNISKISGTKSKKEYSDSDLLVKSLYCGSQICCVYWTENNEILTTHGYAHNDARLFNYPNLKITKIYKFHRNRVVHFAISSDEKYFLTGSSDNNLCFWEFDNDYENIIMR